ncbi:type VI secretion system-associated protein TagF [Marivita sp. S0852]|uniref:type VI secretion system-associated protein TagF n=1 Tax=Marivita sp. S0852 TaxID=3373893 RepID=UPI003982CF77
MKDIDHKPGQTGYFGKIPTQGDFVMHNLPRAVVDGLDDWTRHAVRESQKALGRGWLDAFLVAPVWRAVVARDVLGPDPIALVMMPSVDRVGRYFPLILTVPLPDHRGPLSALPRQLNTWFDQAERLALSTLTPDFRRDTLDQGIKTLTLARWFEPNLRRTPHDAARTLWWVGTAYDDEALRAFDTLPDPARFHDIFLSVRPTPKPVTEEPPAARPAPEPAEQARPDTESVTALAKPLPAVVPETRSRVLLTIQSAGAALKGTHSAALTDTFAIGEDNQAMSVISGIGTHPGLKGAVDTVRAALSDIAEPFSMNDLVAEAKGKLGRANAMLCARGIPTNTTFAASTATLLIQGNRHAVLWCGNARCYLLRDDHLSLLTRDHVDPMLPSLVTRAVGATRQLPLESSIGEARPGDRFLLCSGGLLTMTSDADIAETLKTETSAQHAADQMVQNAIISGARLDVAAVVVILQPREPDGPTSVDPHNPARQTHHDP